MSELLQRQPEPELMDLPDEVDAYARADFNAVNQRFAEDVVRSAGCAAARAVDLGTGPADIPIRVATLRPQWTIAAVDASAPMLDVARAAIGKAGLADRISLVLADAKQSALPSAGFDVVFSNSILHHVASADSFWQEVKRIGKPGGWLFLRDLARPATTGAARRIVEENSGGESKLLQEEFYRSLLAAYTVDEVRAQLKRAGLNGMSVAMASDRHLDVSGRF